jgi:RHS repeat-associated protein
LRDDHRFGLLERDRRRHERIEGSDHRGHGHKPRRDVRVKGAGEEIQMNKLISGACAKVLAGLAAVVLLQAAQAQVPGNVYSYSRTSSFTYYSAADGAKNGLLKSETVEPDNAQSCVTTTYTYDAYGNKNAASTSNCAGATGRAAFTTRGSTTTFAAQTVSVNGTSVSSPAGVFPTSAANALHQSESHQYDPRFGAMTQLTGPNSLPTQWVLDDFGRKIKEIHADGTKTYTWYCVIGAGLDTSSNSVIDGAACPTPLSGEAPADAVAFTHSEPRDANGNKMGPLVRVYTDRLGRAIRQVTESFDGSAQPASRKAALVGKDIIYNAYGAKILETQPYFLSSGSSTINGGNDVGLVRTDYDVLGRPTTIYSADPNGSDASVTFGSYGNRQAAVQTIAYNGLVTTVTNDKRQTRTEEKNVNGEVVRVTDATGAQLAQQRDAFGNLIATKDALQNQLKLVYDIRGRKIQMADPDTGTWNYDYDALGELVWQQSPNELASSATTATTMAYDVLGRMTSRADPEYTSNWYYDSYAGGSACNKGIGKLCESITSSGIDRKTVYDNYGRPINARTDVSGGPSFASAVGYDSVTGRVTSQTYPTGLQVGFAYTPRGFLEKVNLLTAANLTPLPATQGGTAQPPTTLAANSLLWQAQAVNAWGKTEQQLYGNGITSKAAFEVATGRVSDLTAGAGSSTTVLNQHYVWDSLNNLTGRTDANGDGSSGAVSETFSYGDQLDRLTGYSVSGPSIPGYNRSVTLQYNALGMLLYKSDVGNYTYNAQGGAHPHALQSVAGAINTSYQYDANGNLQSATGSKYTSITYTSFNLPDSQGGVQGSGVSDTWQYDENHARIKEVHVAGGNTRTLWYLHPDNQGGLGFESETDTSPAAQNNRHFITAGGQVIGVLVSTDPLPTLAAGQSAPPLIGTINLVKVEYWHKDHLGSLITTTDHLGNVTARYAYDPFGKRRYTDGNYDETGAIQVDWNPGLNNGTPRGFTGHEGLDDVGLVNMNGRFFDASLGVFLQGDPLVQDPDNLQNYNRYGYCYNNPMGCSDPSGYSFWTKFRDSAIRAAAAVADYYGCSGYCSAAVDAYQGARNGGGWRGGVVGGLNGYFGYQMSSQYPVQGSDGSFNYLNIGINAGYGAASGCVSAVATSGKCGQGAANGVISSLGNNYPIIGEMVAGCATGAISGEGCRQGAVDAVADMAGSYVGNAAGSYAVSYLYSSATSTYGSGSIGIKAGTQLDAAAALAVFSQQLQQLQAEGKIPTQNWFMQRFFPDFTFEAGFGVLGPDQSVRVYDSLDAARAAASQIGGIVIGGVTTGNSSMIFITAASDAVIPGVGNTDQNQTMRFVLLHEYGHQPQGGDCGADEGCADSFARRRFKRN